MVYGRAIERVQRDVLPKATPQDRRRGLDLICGMFASAGLTSVHDAMVSNEDLLIYQEAHTGGGLPLRVYLLMYRDHFPALRDAGIKTGFGDDRLRIGGIKMVSDGAIATRTAYLAQPYIDNPEENGGCGCNYGLRVMDPQETEERVLEMHQAGFQVCIHSNGDAAIDMVLTAYEKAQAAYPRKDPRHRIEHCSVVNPDLLRRIKDLGAMAIPFCSYIYYHGEKMPFYGQDRLQRMFAQRSFIDHGINSTGASDYPCSPMYPLMGIQSCVTREDSSGLVWGPDQRITVEEALRLYTINGAYASFEEGIKGSIETGKLGDLVVLGDDPIRVEVHTIKDIPVERTMVGGETIYQK
jgi:predicted amidohydrolase YtcJ